MSGFSFVERGADVIISRHGVPVTTLRGARAARFLTQVTEADPQRIMAAATGNYRRGNERQARKHPRHR